MLLFSLISLLTNLFSSSSFMVTIVAEWSVEGKQIPNQLALCKLGKWFILNQPFEKNYHDRSSCEESRHSLSNTELIVYGVYELLYLSSVYILIIFKGPVLEMKLLHQNGCSFQIIHTWIIYLKVNIHTVPKKSCTTVQSYSVISKYVKHANVIML